ncbi:MAG: hypothetical protein LAN83_19075 [Acidobacteriia bacterium]|nr:hypothetical protein [Terriglobia bacterium]
MKHLISALLLVTLAFGQAGTAPAASGQSVRVEQDSARKAKALIDQMIQALGGPAYLNIEDISQEGRTYSFHLGVPNSLGVQFWRFYKFPDKDRMELTKKRDVVFVENGDKGFEITYKGAKAQEAKDLADYLRRRGYALDWVLRHWLQEPGVALFYEGPTVAEQKNAEQVTIMNARNQGLTLYIDSDTHLPVKKTFSWRDPTDQQRNVEDEVYDAYRPVQGIMTPFSVTRFYNGDMSNQRFLTTVRYNQGLSDSMFEAVLSPNPKK